MTRLSLTTLRQPDLADVLLMVGLTSVMLGVGLMFGLGAALVVGGLELVGISFLLSMPATETDNGSVE
jgi:hypothetical protein